MEVDVADERAVGLDDTPATTGRIIAVVPTNPAELDGRTAIALDVTAIDVPLDGDEAQVARSISSDLDEARTKEVDRIAVPKVHLHDLPTAGHPRHHAPKRSDRSPALPDTGAREYRTRLSD